MKGKTTMRISQRKIFKKYFPILSNDALNAMEPQEQKTLVKNLISLPTAFLASITSKFVDKRISMPSFISTHTKVFIQLSRSAADKIENKEALHKEDFECINLVLYAMRYPRWVQFILPYDKYFHRFPTEDIEAALSSVSDLG